jgi:hypothetical protein
MMAPSEIASMIRNRDRPRINENLHILLLCPDIHRRHRCPNKSNTNMMRSVYSK